MKQENLALLIAAIIFFLLACAGRASAATLEIYPSITNAHGGSANSTNLRSCLESHGVTQCDAGVPTFTFPGGDYSVSVTPPPGYSFTLSGDCEGTVTDEASLQCNVTYKDDQPIASPPPPASAGTVGPIQPTPAVQQAPAPVVQYIPVYIQVPATNTPPVIQQEGDNPVRTVEKVIIIEHTVAGTTSDQATTTGIESTTTPPTNTDLRSQILILIGQLGHLISVLLSKLAAL